jgi:hypothetical protein
MFEQVRGVKRMLHSKTSQFLGTWFSAIAEDEFVDGK